MNQQIEAWAFVEAISPRALPSGGYLEGKKFADGVRRDCIQPLDLASRYPEMVELAKSEAHTSTLTHSYYIDSYPQHALVQLFRDFFTSDEEIFNKSTAMNYSFTFKVGSDASYIEDSLFIPHVQLVIHDIQVKRSIQYKDFLERYEERKTKVVQAAKSIFSNGVDAEAVQKLRTIFQKHFGTLAASDNEGYIGINLENKKNPQNPPLFNSFYIDDLHRILQKGTNETLKQFLDGTLLRVDIDENREAIEEVLQPKNLPLGRWPSPVAHRLSLMQQVAVNEILNGNEKISSVNGPPGTGKTTLLKDVFAQLVIDRTIQLTSYQDPKSAFTNAGKMNINQFPHTMYKLDDKLGQHSIVVASSNNGAIENISKDLPKLGSIVRDSIEPTEEECLVAFKETGTDIRYQYECETAYKEEALALDFYPDLSDNIIQDSPTWGLFSAAMGKSTNITSVSKALNGIQPKDPKIASLADRLFEPIPDDAWTKAVKEFNDVKKSIEQKKSELQRFTDLMKQAEHLVAEQQQVKQDMEETQTNHEKSNQQMNLIKQQKQLVSEQLQNLPAPSIWQKVLSLFSEKKSEDEQRIRTELAELLHEQKELVRSTYYSEQRLEQLTNKVKHLEKQLAEVKSWKERFDNQQVTHSDNLLWSKDLYEERQTAVLWQTDELNFERGLLFLKALQVHKVFLAKNAKQVKAALTVLSNRQSIHINIEQNKQYMENMWKVFHLICPVISTTFASFSSMYKGMDHDFIDYLVIDEAGQASPQQAAGAMWRSKKAIVVGDPIQIEPVVTLDETILNDVRQAFNVSEAYIGTTASVQTLADYANPIGTYTGEKDTRQRIGIPLWVHRRCIEPMFSIANQIAYQNKMVLPIKKVGTGQWLHSAGKATQSQYVEEHGRLIVNRLQRHFSDLQGTDQTPNVFVITPFTAVKDALKSLVRKELKGKFPSVNEWVNRSIGTVHTFQGKEADIVYFVTGTDTATDGAANWSCAKPNLLNVAVTRAKKEFYVVGDAQRFKTKEYYQDIQIKMEQFNESEIYVVKS